MFKLALPLTDKLHREVEFGVETLQKKCEEDKTGQDSQGHLLKKSLTSQALSRIQDIMMYWTLKRNAEE